ncbi:sigma-70 family RNA polymerase sigma factor [Lysinibacter cavernae]|uniref:RNA polymerase sigma factor (Sigma-70 family) n=1 Tax=Lysinibacter cavernae TaxID=1640652 RepID=A0A7X5TSN7_9MICO|nr:sigma-70 family RNA polymerase sigma factor [Lysinibacter cavernae]NIH53691.1 RNA polymerase sigma factor (sigma-70 family) [Lysinibacter cavernae]
MPDNAHLDDDGTTVDVAALRHAERVEGDRSDAELSNAVREGNLDAYATLYARHNEAALRHAYYVTGDSQQAEDLVAEAFASILSTLQRGLGPKETFRGYLFTTISNKYRSRINHNDMQLFEHADEYFDELAVDDETEHIAEGNVLHRAFQSLPEKWQRVLWLNEVDGLSPEIIGRRMNLNSNAVLQLAFRAREGLRLAYLAEHIDEAAAASCAKIRPKLIRYGRDQRIGPQDKQRVQEHLETCEDCKAVLSQLKDVGQHMRGIVAPIFLLAAPTGLTAWLFGDVPAASAASRVLALKLGGILSQKAGVALIGAVLIGATVAIVLALAGVGSGADDGHERPVVPETTSIPETPGADDPTPVEQGGEQETPSAPGPVQSDDHGTDSLDGETEGWVVVDE